MYAKQVTLQQIQSFYDAYIIDLWGVVHNGVDAYPGVVECLNQLSAIQKSIIFLSNAPRPSTVLIDKLLSLGITLNPNMILTSGDVTRLALEKLSAPIYHLGVSRNQDILAGLKVNVVEKLNEASLLLITVYLDEGEDLNQYDTLLREALALKLPAICANPDKEIINGSKARFCSGVFAEKYANMGGVVQYYGKPYSNVYEKVFSRLKDQNIVDKKRILMIGDTLETDVRGAKNAGIDSALVLTGNMHTLVLENKDFRVSESEYLSKTFQQFNLTPTWLLPGLKW